MPNDQPWRWWVSSVAIPVAAFAVAVTGLYVQYLGYTKDINDLRAKVAAENAPKLAAIEADVAKRDEDIQELRGQLAQARAAQLLAEGRAAVAQGNPSTPLLPGLGKFPDFQYKPLPPTNFGDLLKPKPAPPPLGWWDQAVDFLSGNWKVVVVLVFLLGGFLGSKK